MKIFMQKELSNALDIVNPTAAPKARGLYARLIKRKITPVSISGLFKNHGSVTVQKHPFVEDQFHRPRQHDFFHVSARLNHG